MTPPNWNFLLSRQDLVRVVPEHTAHILARLELHDGGDRTRLERNVVRVENHRREIAEDAWERHVGAHVRAVTRGEERDRVVVEEGRHFVEAVDDAGDH